MVATGLVIHLLQGVLPLIHLGRNTIHISLETMPSSPEADAAAIWVSAPLAIICQTSINILGLIPLYSWHSINLVTFQHCDSLCLLVFGSSKNWPRQKSSISSICFQFGVAYGFKSTFRTFELLGAEQGHPFLSCHLNLYQ